MHIKPMKICISNRYPFIASEIFELETSIINIFFQEEPVEDKQTEPSSLELTKASPLLDYLFSIMDSKVMLNDTLAGYYEKVMFSLYKKKTKEVISLSCKKIYFFFKTACGICVFAKRFAAEIPQTNSRENID